LNQVRQIVHGSDEELSAPRELPIGNGHLCKIFPFFSSLLSHLEKLDFSSVSTEAGHRPFIGYRMMSRHRP